MPPEVTAQVGPAEPIQASSACRTGAHAGCADRLAVQTARRCGCRCHRHAERLAYLFYLLAAGAAVIGQVWVAVEHIPWPQGWPMWIRVAAVVPFAVCLELLGMVTAALADQRMRLGERALGLRVFSTVVAAVAVTVIVAGHWPDMYLVAAFGAFSGSAYLLWMLHASARRRDALRAAGLLNRVSPTYGCYRWLPLLGRPGWRVTHRARELAIERGLSLHESLLAAERELREQARRPAIAAAVKAVVKANQPDPLMAEIAVRTLDHDRIAVELEAAADYPGWAQRLAAAVSASPPPALSGHQPDTKPDDDRPDTDPRPDTNNADEPAATEPAPGQEPHLMPDQDQPDTGPRPDTSNADEPAAPHQPTDGTGTDHRMRVSGPDNPSRRLPRPDRQVIARGVAEALSRTPQPTQVEIAQELGISDRSVRRYRDELLVNRMAA
jgi:hypothetical protein